MRPEQDQGGSVHPHRRRPDSRRSTSSEPEKAPRLLAGLVAGQAHSANLRPERINRARRRYADLTDQSGAAISFATHATVVVIDEESWNPIELSIALRGEPRPIRRKRTTGTASPAYRHPAIERVSGIEHHRPKHLRTVHHAASHGGTAAIFVESPCGSPERFSRNSWPKDSWTTAAQARANRRRTLHHSDSASRTYKNALVHSPSQSLSESSASVYCRCFAGTRVHPWRPKAIGRRRA
jgi:hypothetical protein